MLISDFIQILAVRVQERIGADGAALGGLAYERAVSARSRSLKMTPDTYIEYFLATPSEETELLQGFLISETWFQRDVLPLQMALATLTPTITTLRVLSAPCASGEEVITVLCSALEAGIPLELIQVDGVDLSEQAITRAKACAYGRYSFRGCDAQFQERYFDTRDGISVLKSELKSRIHYSKGNLLDTVWVNSRPRYDLVLCRNLLIYLMPDARRQVIGGLSQLLNPEGIFVATAAESPFIGNEFFSAASAHHSLFRKNTPSPSLPTEPKSRPGERRRNAIAKQLKTQKRLSNSPINRPRPSLNTPLPTILEAKTTNGELPTLDTLSYEEALQRLEHNPSNADLLFILGVLTSQSGDLDGAKRWFEQALDSSPEHEDAQLFIAALGQK